MYVVLVSMYQAGLKKLVFLPGLPRLCVFNDGFVDGFAVRNKLQFDRNFAISRSVKKKGVASLTVYLHGHTAGLRRDTGTRALQLRKTVEPDRLVCIAGDDFERSA